MAVVPFAPEPQVMETQPSLPRVVEISKPGVTQVTAAPSLSAPNGRTAGSVPADQPRVTDVGPGSQIGGYTIERLIGRGGMGFVFQGYHDRLKRVAAIKVLARYGTSPEGIRRFEREAQTVARLRHPQILAVFDFGEYCGQPYMVAEYMPNGSMQSRMPEGPAPFPQVIAVLRPLAAALDYAHEQGVIHRDVKPANVFLDAQFRPILADFGLAKLHSDVDLTATGTVSGTPSYIAPEQATGGTLTGATDRYSLAVMAFRLFTGQLPFRGTAVMDVLFAHVHNPPPLPSSINPELPAEVDAVLLKGLAKDPAERWSTCAEMVDALEAAVESTIDVAAITQPTADPAPTQPSLAAVPTPPAAKPRGRVSRLALATGLAVLLSVGVGFAAFKVEGSRVPATPSPVSSGAVVSGPARSIQIDQPGPIAMGSTIVVSGKGLDPNLPANVGIQVDPDHLLPLASSNVGVAADGSFSIMATIPKTGLKEGPVKLLACNVVGQNGTSNCIDLLVTVTK